MDILRTPESRFANLPGYPFAPHYVDVSAADTTPVRMHYVDEGPRDGEPVVLNPAEAATYADANALIAWSLGLQTSIKSSFTAGSLIGRGSGEAFQVAFQGAGFVIVQPSEGPQVPTTG